MSKALLISFFLIVFSSCSRSHKEFDKNLSSYKQLTAEINNYFIDKKKEEINVSDFYTEDFIFYSFPAGNKKGVSSTKKEYIDGFQEMKRSNMLLNVGHSIYLPGINEDTWDFDGSLRVYYGATISIDLDSVEFSGYRTVNFNNGKISAIWEWADYGGVYHQLKQL